MSKVTVHTQIPPHWLAAFLRESNAKHYKGIGNLPCFDGVATIGRAVVDENKEPEPLNTFIATGDVGADVVFDACVPVIEKNPQVKWWILYNESAIWEERVLNGFVDFNQQLIRRFRLKYGDSKKIIVGAINTGHPKLITEDGGREMDVISQAFQGADGYAIHGYHPEHLLKDINYHVCRYRHMHNYCLSIDRPHPPFFLLEFGLDAPGGPNHGHYGWKHILQDNWPAYRDMIVGLEAELQKDDYVECATLYIAEVSYGWDQFEINESQAMELADALNDIPVPPPVPDYARGIDVSDHQGVIDWDAVKAAGYDFAMIRASVCRSDGSVVKDGHFDRNWAEAKRVGILRGAYHYLGVEAGGQAKFFVETVGDDLPEIRYYGDLEHGGLDSERCQRFLEAVDRNLQERAYPINVCDVYSRASFLNRFGIPLPWSVGRNLWVASPGQPEPVMPDAWTEWEFWQYGQRTVPGIEGLVDVNYFNGTREELFAKYGGEEPEVKIQYYLAGNKVSDDAFYAVFGNGYQPYTAVGDGSNDDFPDILKAQIHKMAQVDNMSLECHLQMLDGSVPNDIEQYEFVIWIHGNDYRADFEIKDGKAIAAWVMGHDGWWYNPQDGSAGAAICFVGRKDGELHSEQVRGVGWFSDETYGSHCHGNLVFTIEPSGTPPPIEYHYLYYSAEPEEAGYVVAVPAPVDDQLPEGTIVTLTAFANPGWTFSHWSVPAAPEWSVTLEMTQDWAVAAVFVKDTGEIDIPAAKEDGYNALGSIGSALVNLGESANAVVQKLAEMLS